jgi:STE24 endopeptidase
MRDPAAVPLALLVLVVLQLLALPAQSAITRNMEAEADWVALETTEDPEAVTRLWRGFADEALVDPSPPTWSYLLLDTHPSMAKRVAMAEAWRERNE